MYKQVLSSAQKYRAKYEQRAKEKYHYWEIGGEQSIGIGPVRGQSKAKIKIRAIINGKRKAFNAVEELIQWRKFNQIEDMLLTAIQTLSPEMSLVLLSVIWGKTMDEPGVSTITHLVDSEYKVLQDILSGNSGIFNDYEHKVLEGFTFVWFTQEEYSKKAN